VFQPAHRLLATSCASANVETKNFAGLSSEHDCNSIGSSLVLDKCLAHRQTLLPRTKLHDPADVKSVPPGYRTRTKPQSGGTAWCGARV